MASEEVPGLWRPLASSGGFWRPLGWPCRLVAAYAPHREWRALQVELVNEFVEAVRGGRPLVKQMLMGGGKTTVRAQPEGPDGPDSRGRPAGGRDTPTPSRHGGRRRHRTCRLVS